MLEHLPSDQKIEGSNVVAAYEREKTGGEKSVLKIHWRCQSHFVNLSFYQPKLPLQLLHDPLMHKIGMLSWENWDKVPST